MTIMVTAPVMPELKASGVTDVWKTSTTSLLDVLVGSSKLDYLR